MHKMIALFIGLVVIVMALAATSVISTGTVEWLLLLIVAAFVATYAARKASQDRGTQ